MAKQIPISDQIDIASPCDADWDSMSGSDRIRVCEHCNLTVNNLSTMTIEQVEELVAQSNGRLCVRYFQLPDGRPQLAERPSVLLQLGRKSSRIAASAITVAMAVSAPAAAYSQGVARIKPPQTVETGKDQNGAVNGASALIRGLALDPNGDAVGNARLILIGPHGQKEMVLANEAGEFRFQSLEPGIYALEVRSIGFVDFRITGIKLSPGEEKQVKAVLQVAPSLMGGIMFGAADVVIVEPILKPTVKPTSRPRETGFTPLMFALRSNSEKTIKEMLASGVDVNVRTSYGVTALMYIGASTSSKTVTDLLLAGADLHLMDTDGRTALMLAAGRANSIVLQKLIEAGANIDDSDSNGNTALIYAVTSHRPDNVQTLITAKANLKIQNHDGFTALKYAIKQNSTEIARMLKSAGAVE